jgi:hypothetical protein
MNLQLLKSALAELRKRWSDTLLSVLTVLLALMLFVFAPLEAIGIVLFQKFEFTTALLIIGGVFFITGNRATTTAAMLIAFGMAIAAAILRLNSPSATDVYLLSGALLIMAVTLTAASARAVFAPGRVTYHRIVGAILIYLSVAVIFMALYTIVGLMVPKAFSGIVFDDDLSLTSRIIYFSFVTLTTTGYGDVIPVHPAARSLCNLESIFGQLYPATLLARLVTLETADRD